MCDHDNPDNPYQRTCCSDGDTSEVCKGQNKKCFPNYEKVGAIFYTHCPMITKENCGIINKETFLERERDGHYVIEADMTK